MSGTSGRSKTQGRTPLTPPKSKGLSAEDLALVAERLALIQGHLAKMPQGVISGVTIMNGFLLVALRIEDHALNVVSGVWTLDGKDVTQLIVPLGDSAKTANKV
jgi:hypothetical protein